MLLKVPHMRAGRRTAIHAVLLCYTNLLQSLHLDANASDQPDDWQRGPCCGTPLCYVAHSGAGQRGIKEVVWMLMDAGPLLEVKGLEWNALEMAQQIGNTAFVEAVDEWRAAS